ncbi:MAG: 50S ribosomal protein L24 [Thermoplasmata archaeon]|nr:MAG: 50S ribosomal protein L24 [Thermoplasmata archaeon]RLF36776.1 MAG: 50S ribosomal protein L24 [Thermoplasmata archaeon]
MKSTKPRKQRKNLFNAPLHKKRKWLAAHLAENLLLKYDRRSIPVIKGDTVKIMRGSFRGHEEKIARVNVKKGYVEVEGVTMIKADGKKIAKPIHPSNLLITKLNLTDRWRRMKLEKGLPEEVKQEIEKEAEEQIKTMEKEEIEKETVEEGEVGEKQDAAALSDKEKAEEKPIEEKTEVTKTKTTEQPKKENIEKHVSKTKKRDKQKTEIIKEKTEKKMVQKKTVKKTSKNVKKKKTGKGEDKKE